MQTPLCPAPSPIRDLRPESATGSRDTVWRLDFRAMGSGFSLLLVSDDAEGARSRMDAAWAFVQLAESTLSRFRPDSELCRLNATSGEPVQISPILLDVMIEALRGTRRSGGVYDPTILPALEYAGYNRSLEEMLEEGPAHPDVFRPPGASNSIRVDENTRTVTLPHGTRIDLGGIAKGWTAERAADILAPLGPCLVDAGGDIAARGCPPSYGGWCVGVMDPNTPEHDRALLEVSDVGIATSGVDFRRWRRDGVEQHHIIDPNTGLPARTDLLTATIIAPDAIQADLSALVAVALGSQQGLEYIESLAGVEGLLVTRAGEALVSSGLHRYLLPRQTCPNTVEGEQG